MQSGPVVPDDTQVNWDHRSHTSNTSVTIVGGYSCVGSTLLDASVTCEKRDHLDAAE